MRMIGIGAGSDGNFTKCHRFKAPIRQGASEEPADAVSNHRCEQQSMRGMDWTEVAMDSLAAGFRLDPYFVQPPADHKGGSADTRIDAHRPNRTVDAAGTAFHAAVAIFNRGLAGMIGKDGLGTYLGTHLTTDAHTPVQTKAGHTIYISQIFHI